MVCDSLVDLFFVVDCGQSWHKKVSNVLDFGGLLAGRTTFGLLNPFLNTTIRGSIRMDVNGARSERALAQRCGRTSSSRLDEDLRPSSGQGKLGTCFPI